MSGDTSESAVLRDILTRLSNSTIRLIRQQSGNFLLADGRRLQVGVPGLSDLVGLRSIIVTPEMVGRRFAVFVAIEVKSKSGKPRPNQLNFIDVVAQLGGYAGIARSVDEARGILRLDR